MSAANVIELRRLLAEKFPGVRTRMEAPVERIKRQTGLEQIDEAGGLPEGALTEVVAEQASSGSALVMRLLLKHAAETREIAAVIDGQDSLDVTSLEEGVLSRLLWVRCKSVDKALQAADLILRDGNLSFVMLDLVGNSPLEIRKISATTWYRFQRLVEDKTTVCVIFTPKQMVVPAQMRVRLLGEFSLSAIEQKTDVLLRSLTMEVVDSRQGEVNQLRLQGA